MEIFGSRVVDLCVLPVQGNDELQTIKNGEQVGAGVFLLVFGERSHWRYHTAGAISGWVPFVLRPC
jgi:hypothetical protein